MELSVVVRVFLNKKKRKHVKAGVMYFKTHLRNSHENRELKIIQNI
jgi:hypothetical protein